MSAEQTRGVIERELGGACLEDVFEWIDLEKPLGSASLAQVRFHDTFSVTRPPALLFQHCAGTPVGRAGAVSCRCMGVPFP